MSESSGGGAGFIASILIVVGILWMALAGLCSGAVIFSSMQGGGQDFGNLLGALPVVLGFGTAGAAPGLLIWLGGRALRNRRNSAGR